MKKGEKGERKLIENMTNLILTLNNNNTIQKIKNITIIVTIIDLIIFTCNLYYLHNLKKCVCFKELNIDKKINLNYLLFINYILIFTIIINIINIINTSTTQKGGSMSRIFIVATTITLITLLLYISIYSYYIYNIYEIYKKNSISKDCDCLESKFKYSLYIHGAISSVLVIMTTITLILFIVLLIYVIKVLI